MKKTLYTLTILFSCYTATMYSMESAETDSCSFSSSSDEALPQQIKNQKISFFKSSRALPLGTADENELPEDLMKDLSLSHSPCKKDYYSHEEIKKINQAKFLQEDKDICFAKAAHLQLFQRKKKTNSAETLHNKSLYQKHLHSLAEYTALKEGSCNETY